MKNNLSTSTVLAVGLIFLAVASRVARHYGLLDLPPNVAPITAVALFSGVVLPRRYTFIVPLAAMLLSDLFIGFYTLPVMLAVYACFAISNVLGLALRRRQTPARIFGFSLIGSVVFFLVTNAAVWAFQTMYPHTVSGLMQAYSAGLPFFRNTVVGDLGYSIVLFGSYAAVMLYSRRHGHYVMSING